eukprot:TRINITY_DN3074_c0_g1_i1.p1 TRINITY_DN3074_c0_g1~~TRINITY_DN3074_c0_g1_i1.p1  ORF type:complete len:441 (+),score=119.32 TRINITY_DN3074_c0_g1_i1:432-1754(+)
MKQRIPAAGGGGIVASTSSPEMGTASPKTATNVIVGGGVGGSGGGGCSTGVSAGSSASSRRGSNTKYAVIIILLLLVMVGMSVHFMKVRAQYAQERMDSIAAKELAEISRDNAHAMIGKLRASVQRFDLEKKEELEEALSVAARRAQWQNVPVEGADRDVMMLSFPKSGRTWMRIMIEVALQVHFNLTVDGGDEGEMVRMTKNRKNFYTTDSMRDLRPEVPRMVFTHGGNGVNSWHYFHPFVVSPADLMVNMTRYLNLKEALSGKNVVFLSRDPRDVVVSTYYERHDREKLKDRKYNGELRDFLYEEVGSFKTIVTFFRLWHEECRRWANTHMLMRYEDLHEAPEDELRRLFDYLGIGEIEEKVLWKAVSESTFQKMQEKEHHLAFGKSRDLKPRDKTNPNSFKVREGKVGSYHKHFTEADIEWMDQYMAENLPSVFGYV